MTTPDRSGCYAALLRKDFIAPVARIVKVEVDGDGALWMSGLITPADVLKFGPRVPCPRTGGPVVACPQDWLGA